MGMYIAKFERINFGVRPALKQTADVFLQTDIPFEDKHLQQFEAELWKALWEQNPHWANPLGPAGVPSGWSSVMGGRDITVVDESSNLSLVWHCPTRCWLQQDGVTTTIYADEAGRFNFEEVLALEAQYPGASRPDVMSNLVETILPQVNQDEGARLQIHFDEFFAREGSHRAERPIDLFERRAGLIDPAKGKWAWQFTQAGGSCSGWTLADSEEHAREQALDYALRQMRQSGYHHSNLVLATKNNVQVRDFSKS